ncbi:MAG: hypothetical protein AB7O24_17640 [Kofleriaceae bacterium]
MRWLLPFLAVIAAYPSAANARPTADVVVVWAPGADIKPVEAAGRNAGAAVIDRSPVIHVKRETAALIQRGITEYQNTNFDRALELLDEARATADKTGAADLSQTELSDLFLYRGLAKLAKQDATSWDEFVNAVTVAPTRVLNAAQFSPTAVDQLTRARAAVLERPKATLVIAVPIGCTAAIDGITLSTLPSASALPGAGIPRPLGPHWVNVTCIDRAPWGARVELASDATITAANLPLVPPALDELLIQARTMGAQAFVVAEVTGRIGTVRLIGIDGRERDRRTVTVVDDLKPLAATIKTMLAPEAERRWYRSRWVWAASAAVIAAAIAIPITAAVMDDDRPTSATLRPQGFSW